MASDAPPDRFESLLTRARSSGMPGPQLDRLENARKLGLHIYSQLDRRHQREASLSALVDIARELSAPYDLKTLLKVTTRRARMLLGADISYITLLTSEKGTARVEASDGHVSSFHVGMRIPQGAGSSDVLTTSAPFWSADYLADARFPHHERLDEMVRAEELRGIMAVPLCHSSGPFGVLHVADREPRHFSADEVSLMSSLGDLAGAVIEKSRLMDRTAAEVEMLQRRTDEAEAGHRQWQKVCDLHEFLMSQVLSGCDPQSLAEAAVDGLGGVLTLCAGDGTVLASTAGAQRDDELMIPRAMMDAHAEGKAVQVEDGLWAAPVVMSDENLGAVLLRTERPLRESGIRLLGLVAQATAVLLLRQNSHGIVMESQARDGLLDDLVNRARSTRELDRRARKLGVALEKSYVVVVASPVGDARRKAMIWASSYAHRNDGLKSEQAGRVVFLLPGADAAKVAREVHNDLSPLLRHLVTVSAAGPVSGAGPIHRSYLEALRCLEVMGALGLSGRSAAASELGFLGLLVSDDHDVDAFIESVIGPVARYDDQRLTQLTDTLEAFFHASGSPTHAAKTLHVHPNTVARRLERVSELLGEGWQHPDRALEVQLALKLRRMRSALMGREPLAGGHRAGGDGE
ncbi:helix-turn-helix domain-containing protein [Streptomyces sodiiphilus]|uniref:helix-turn-helix domain-containing protein n=1 Tax=Streptomyces sodiiphilus TaxID=226217 RepID=UPI0031DB087B